VQCLKSGIKNITLSNGQYSNWDFIIEGKKIDVKTIINGQGPLENLLCQRLIVPGVFGSGCLRLWSSTTGLKTSSRLLE